MQKDIYCHVSNTINRTRKWDTGVHTSTWQAEFKVSLVYIVSSRLDRTTQRDPVIREHTIQHLTKRTWKQFKCLPLRTQ